MWYVMFNVKFVMSDVQCVIPIMMCNFIYIFSRKREDREGRRKKGKEEWYCIGHQMGGIFF